MDLPDCPPGAEGYQDSVTEVPKKPDDTICTKAEQEFQDHLNSLKIKLEDGSFRCMADRRGRDGSGKWIYLCYPCAAVCNGENIMQTHISGKKHKTKLSSATVWPLSIFKQHPYIQNENKMAATNSRPPQKLGDDVEFVNQSPSDLDMKYNKLKEVRCHIQDTLDKVTAPLIGVEYLIEHPPIESHYEPSYMCTLCSKQGHPRTIVNHLTCFWHRYNYLQRHYTRACALLKPYRGQNRYREGVIFIMNRVAQRIVEKYGLMRPVNIDKEIYEREKDRIHQWIFKGQHFSETDSCTFEEVVDIDLINMLHKSDDETAAAAKDPSPPVVAVPKPQNNSNRVGVGVSAGARAARRARRPSVESLSDLSDELERTAPEPRDDRTRRYNQYPPKPRYEPYADRGRDASARGRYAGKVTPSKPIDVKVGRPPNYEYKVKLADEKRQAAADAAKKTLAYHEKNPEKHPLYPEEWKKFWNRRYKEIQAEGKDPSKHDFKPEWIVFWTGRMKELHNEELRIQVNEIYRKMCLTPPAVTSPNARASDAKESRRRSPELKERRDVRRRSPVRPVPMRSAPSRPPVQDSRRHSPDYRRSPGHRRSPDHRRRSPDLRRRSPPHRREHRSPNHHHRRSPPRRHSPSKMVRTRSRSPNYSMRSPARTNFVLESRSSRSPLSRRETAHRNRSPVPRNRSPGVRDRSPGHRNRSPVRNRSLVRDRSPVHRNRSPVARGSAAGRADTRRHRSPVASATLQTVLVSDDELKPDDGISPWNSDNSLESLGSLPDARSPVGSGSARSMHTRSDRPERSERPEEGADNIVATLRMLVALEDYLGSLGPKIVDLLAEAIKMEKDKANSSEELLERDTALVLIETAKEKLKGAAQAGLVAAAAAAAVRAAVVRAAATLHEADKRARARKAELNKKSDIGKRAGDSAAAVPVAGVGEVDRAQIAQQMAAALVAQGKTDVSSEELAQLVDAVVGMAEAKKREADEKKQATAKALANKTAKSSAMSGTASALQMLQSAYDDKKNERDDAPDAMDGLSDSDLETLLKNFNELSAEEQHSLIAYLKKLEAREPQRVERLRQYVSAAARSAHAAPLHSPPAAPPNAPLAPREAPRDSPAQDGNLVTIDSDDDDYTVEDVFKSATEKVKEDQIRQEMEIVKKSLEESKVTAAEAAPAPAVELGMSSAAGLLALVHASLQSQKPAMLHNADVVASSTQPRSFGDLPEAPMHQSTAQPTFISTLQNKQQQPMQHFKHQDTRIPQNIMGLGVNNPNQDTRVPQNVMGFGGNNPNEDTRVPQNMGFGGNNPNDDMRVPQNMGFGNNRPNEDTRMPQNMGFGDNHPNEDTRVPQNTGFGGNNPNEDMRIPQNNMGFGANHPNEDTRLPQNKMGFGGNNSNEDMRVPQNMGFGGNNPNEDKRVSQNMGFGSNNPNEDMRVPKNLGFGGNNPNMREPLLQNPPVWEPRQEHGMHNMPRNMPGNRGPPPRDQGYNYPQENTYNQERERAPQDNMYNQWPPGGNYNNMNSGRKQNYDARPHNNNQNQYSNYEQNNSRGRGGRGNFSNRGRGRGRGYF